MWRELTFKSGIYVFLFMPPYVVIVHTCMYFLMEWQQTEQQGICMTLMYMDALIQQIEEKQ